MINGHTVIQQNLTDFVGLRNFMFFLTRASLISFLVVFQLTYLWCTGWFGKCKGIIPLKLLDYIRHSKSCQIEKHKETVTYNCNTGQ